MRIAIEVTVRAPLARVWSVWTTPDDIMAWNATSDDWHCPHAEATFAVGGRFSCRMEARDGSVGFDFEGFAAIEEGQRIDCLLDDERGGASSSPKWMKCPGGGGLRCGGHAFGRSPATGLAGYTGPLQGTRRVLALARSGAL